MTTLIRLVLARFPEHSIRAAFARSWAPMKMVFCMDLQRTAGDAGAVAKRAGHGVDHRLSEPLPRFGSERALGRGFVLSDSSFAFSRMIPACPRDDRPLAHHIAPDSSVKVRSHTISA